MHFDPTVNLGNLLTLASGFVAFLVFYGKVVQLISVMKEYPPHKHIGRTIIFPAGYKGMTVEEYRVSETESDK